MSCNNTEKQFWSQWAKYKGRDYRSVSYGNNKVELYDKDDFLMKNLLYTVTSAELEDSYTLMIRGILQGIEYLVYEIENETVTYTKYVSAQEFVKKPVTDFELIYSQKNHRDYVEKDIIFIDEKRIDREKVNQRFWPNEMASGNIMFSVLEDVITIKDLNIALEKLYSARITDKGGFPEAILWDEYQAWLSIDGHRLDINSDLGIVTVAPNDEGGNKYIMEIVDYLNQIF